MGELNETNILDALKEVKDPDLHRDIVTLNFVKNITIEQKNVRLSIELTTPACPVRDELKAAAVQAIRKRFPDIGSVDVEMTSNVTRAERTAQPSPLPQVKNMIAVASGKGGVGKSTVAVNLAVSLALDGARVGLADVDIYGPSLPLMMGITGRPSVKNQRLQPMEKHNVKAMSIGFLVDPMQAVIWRGPMASSAVKQFIGDVDWGELDYLVFDLPPGTGDVQLTLSQAISLTGAVIVTTPQDISLADARKGLKMFEKVNVPVLGIVENMSYYVCTSCGHRDEIFDSGGGRKAAEELGVPFLGDIPLHTSIRVSGDKGAPIVLEKEKSPQADALRKVARNLAAQVSIRNASRSEEAGIEIRLMK